MAHLMLTLAALAIALVFSVASEGSVTPCLVKDIDPRTQRDPFVSNTSPSRGVEVGGLLLFAATEPSAGRELWRSDGSEAGTVLVADLNPGSEGSDPRLYANVGGRVFFTADEPDTGRELWTSDGTPEGTVRVTDINPGPMDSFGRTAPFASVGSLLYFVASSPDAGRALWKSDGSGAGTAVVADLPSTAPSRLTTVGANVYVEMCSPYDYGDCELWKSDGTESGTQLLATIGLPIWDATGLNNKLVFVACAHPGNCELWASDGTPAGTVEVVEFDPSDDASGDDEDWNPPVLATLGGAVVFAAIDEGGEGPWRSDGTSAGTTRIAYVSSAAPNGSNAFQFVSVGPRVLFRAFGPSSPWQLWTSDGTEAGTTPLDVVVGESLDTNVAIGDRLFFYAELASGIFESDGTESGTVLRAEVPEGVEPSWLTPASGLLFFGVGDERGGELWALPLDGATCQSASVTTSTATTSSTPASSTTSSSTSSSSSSTTSTTSPAPPDVSLNCDDADPCTTDRATNGVCVHEPPLGPAGIACVCERLPSVACSGRSATSVNRKLEQACRLLEHAGQADKVRERLRSTRRSERALKMAERRMNRERTKGRLPRECEDFVRRAVLVLNPGSTSTAGFRKP